MQSTLVKAVFAGAIVAASLSATTSLFPTAHAALVQQARPDRFNDQVFLQHSLETSLFEVKVGQLAKDKGTAQGVKDFGDRLITDHNKAIMMIKALAEKKNFQYKEELTPKQDKAYEMLAGHVGADFDLEFAKHMVKGHEMAIKEALDAGEKTNDPEVKNLADSLISSYRQHLDVAKALETQLHATAEK
jgi:putative membrane protein